MGSGPLLLVYALPLAVLWAVWAWLDKARSRRAKAVLEDNLQAGLNEPSSLHPVIDPNKCLGCASCVHACPEKTVLGVIDGEAMLIDPTACVGHGACQTACPTDAISLVFGSATRGVEIPVLTPDFETSVPGIYIAGELGGMGLIRNAIEQGRQAIAAIAARTAQLKKRNATDMADVLDVAIIGCGPAGIAASLGAMEHRLTFVTLDQASLGGTVAHFPRGKLVMTAPATLPIIGKVRFGEVSKEKLLAFWQDVLARTGLTPRFEEQVTGIIQADGVFDITTSKGRYRASSILLAIGRRGTPRPLGVQGEGLPKVVYHLIDPEQYAGQRVLVVGGGDSALEAASRIAEQPGTHVTLSYRGAAYGRARAKNRDTVQDLAAQGRIEECLNSQVSEIQEDRVILNCNGAPRILPNDAVIICAGGLLPTQFLHDIGVAIEVKYGTA